MKKINVILIILACLVIVVSIAKDAIIKNSIKGIISVATGLRVDIGELKASVRKGTVSVKDMAVFNPAGFPDKVLLDIPAMRIDYDLSSLSKGDMHLYNMYINLREVTIVKTKDGTTSLDQIKNLRRKKKEDVKESPDSRKSTFLIDNLALKVGKVVYKDYSMGRDPLVTEYKINLDSRYKNVKNTDEIMRIIMAKAIFETAIGNLSDFKKFKDIPYDTLRNGKQIIKKTVDELKGLLNAPF